MSIENPENSFAWMVRVMAQLLKRRDMTPHGLDQCPYGAETVKPTQASLRKWILAVGLRCNQVRRHRHRREGGPTGLVWDPISEQQVWRSAKAAEYPAGLCWAWAESLDQWLKSRDGLAWMAVRTMVKVGKFNNTLVNLEIFSQELAPRGHKRTVEDDERGKTQSQSAASGILAERWRGMQTLGRLATPFVHAWMNFSTTRF